MKVAVASNESTRSEADVLAKLCHRPSPLGTTQLPVPRLLDSFDLKGPNGIHNVIALEPLGCTLHQFIDEMNAKLRDNQNYGDTRVLRELSRQLVYAVHYIHSKGIVHRGPKAPITDANNMTSDLFLILRQIYNLETLCFL